MRRATPCRTTSWSAVPRRATASFTSTTSQASEWRSTGTTPSVTRPDAGRSLTAERWVSQVRGARLLRGDRATHRRAMHQTALGHVVVRHRPVLDHAVVPHQHVARPPLMAIHERGLDDVIRQGGDQRLRLVGPYPLDAGAVVAHHVEARAARPRMGPHDGMANRRVTVDFRLRRGQGPLASAEIEHGSPSLQASLHRIRQGVPGRSGTGELGVSQREPVQLGDLDGVQDGPAWWSRGVAHVAVPVLAGAADAGRPTALGDVGQDDDLGVAGHAPALAEDVEFDLAEAARERHLLRGRDRLPTEEDDAVFVVGAFDRGERGVVERPGEIHPGDLRAEHGGGRNAFHGHWTILSTLDLAARLPYGSGGGRTASMARPDGE